VEGQQLNHVVVLQGFQHVHFSEMLVIQLETGHRMISAANIVSL
jgi:hypothetical protein